MGVRDFLKLIRKYAPDTIKVCERGLEDWSGKTIAIDATLFSLRFYHASRGPSQCSNQHLSFWYEFLQRCRRYDITPICVFDSDKRAPQKSQETLRRQERKSLNYFRGIAERSRHDKLETLQNLVFQICALDHPEKQSVLSQVQRLLEFAGDDAETSTLMESTSSLAISVASLIRDIKKDQLNPIYAKSQKNLIPEAFDLLFSGPVELDWILTFLENLTTESDHLANRYRRRSMFNPKKLLECVNLVRSLGFPVLITPDQTEAEATCASLVQRGFADVVATEDTDVLVYGFSMLRNMNGQTMTYIDGEEVRKALNLTRSQFVDLAIVCGTDFSSRLYKIGPLTAYRLIFANHSIKEIFELAPRNVSWKEYQQAIQDARQIFQFLPPVPPGPYECGPQTEGIESLIQSLKLESTLDTPSYAKNLS